MPHYKLGFESAYIAAVDFGAKEPTVTIVSVSLDEIADPETGKARNRWVARFDGIKRGWVINKTNAILLSALTGSEQTEGWIGQRVTLCAEEVDFGKTKVQGIRVKGSPDLAAPMDVTVKLPKKRPRVVRLLPTVKSNG